MVDQDPVGPAPEGAGDPASALYKLNAQLAAGAANGVEAYRQAFNEIRAQLESLMPAFENLGKLDKDTLTAYRRQFKEQESVARAYFSTVSSEEEKRLHQIQDNLRKQEATITKFHERLRVAREKDAKDEAEKINIGQEERGRAKEAISRVRGQAHAQEVGGNPAMVALGGQIESLVAPLMAFADVGKLISMAFDTGQALFGAGGAAARAGGGTASVARGYGAVTSGLGSLLGPGLGVDQASEIMSKVLGQAPQLLGKDLTPVASIMANMGITAEQSADMMAKANASASTSVEQMVRSLNFSVVAGKTFGFGLDATVKQVMDFTRAVRTTGADSNTAAKQAREWVASVQQAGREMGLGNEEMTSFAGKFQSAISGMAPSKAAGLVMATTGRMPGSLDELSKKVQGPDFAKGVYNLISKNVGKQGQMFVPEAFGQLMGMGHVDMQTAKLIQTWRSEGGGTQRASEMGLQSDSGNLRQAMVSLSMMQSPLQMIANLLQNTMSPAVVSIATTIDKRLGSNPDINEKSMGQMQDVLSGNPVAIWQFLQGLAQYNMEPQHRIPSYLRRNK